MDQTSNKWKQQQQVAAKSHNQSGNQSQAITSASDQQVVVVTASGGSNEEKKISGYKQANINQQQQQQSLASLAQQVAASSVASGKVAPPRQLSTSTGDFLQTIGAVAGGGKVLQNNGANIDKSTSNKKHLHLEGSKQQQQQQQQQQQKKKKPTSGGKLDQRVNSETAAPATQTSTQIAAAIAAASAQAQAQLVAATAAAKASLAHQSPTSSGKESDLSEQSLLHNSNNNNISSQVDQGNSYLYAYNDFVTSTQARALEKGIVARPTTVDLNPSGGNQLKQSNQLQQSSKYLLPANHHLFVDQETGQVTIASGQQVGRHNNNNNNSNNQLLHHQDETLIDSDEDDNLSYILHQYRPNQVQDLAYYPAAPCCLGNLFTSGGVSVEPKQQLLRNNAYESHHQQEQQILAAAAAAAAATNATQMYHSNSNAGNGGHLGQPGAYYAASDQRQDAAGTILPTASSLHAQHHPHHHHSAHLNNQQQQQHQQLQQQAHQHHLHQHHHQQQHHYHSQLSSDSSLNSSSLFASSALRMNSFFRSCCSKKCLLISFVMFIILILMFVIGLSAYLNLLINLNKVNLLPLSGRLRVETQGDTYSQPLANRTSREFLLKQQQYETILRGALDRTQSLLKNYPQHLVKLEVYSFKAGSLWVYFRLFLNKKSLMSDSQLMKRKSPDESLDKQFLPRLTQQTLQSGFEQLMSNSATTTTTTTNLPLRLSRSSQNGGPLATQQDSRSPRSATSGNVKSFDEQISRLMPIIESIDLQSIQVAQEFDMSTSAALNSRDQEPPSMSDGLRGSDFLTTTTSSTTASSVPGNSAIMVANGSLDKRRQPVEYELTPSGGVPANGTVADEIRVVTNKFTLYGYKDNATRPTNSAATPTTTTTTNPLNNSLFLVNFARKPTGIGNQNAKPKVSADSTSTPMTTITPLTQTTRPMSNTLKDIAAAQGNLSAGQSGKVVKLNNGQPLVSQNINLQARQPANGQSNNNLEVVNAQSSNKTSAITLFAPSSSSSSGSNRPPIPPASSTLSSTTSNPTSTFTRSTSPSSSNGSQVNETLVLQMVAPYQKVEFSTSTSSSSSSSSSAAAAPATNGRNEASIQDLWESALNSGKKNVTKPEQQQQQPRRLITTTTIGSNQNGTLNLSEWRKISELSTPASSTSSSGSTSTSATQTATSQRPPMKVTPHLRGGHSTTRPSTPSPESSVLLNRDIAEGQLAATAAANQTQQTGGRVSAPSTQAKPDKQQQQQRKPSNASRNSGDSQQQQPPKPRNNAKPKSQKVKKVSGSNDTTTNASVNSQKAIKIVDNFLQAAANGTFADSSPSGQLRNNGNRSAPADASRVVTIIPTQPTTIELTRSTSSQPSAQSTSRLSGNNNNNREALNLDYTTTTSSLVVTPAPTDSSSSRQKIVGENVVSQLTTQINRPGTSNFSNQWRPIQQAANETSTRRPAGGSNLSLIIGTERLPVGLTAPSASQAGSQSPFAMSTAIFEPNSRAQSSGSNNRRVIVNNNNNGNGNANRRTQNKLTNTYQANGVSGNNRAPNLANNNNNNEFESHRMSRMRQQVATNGGDSSSGLMSMSSSSSSLDNRVFSSSSSSSSSTTRSSLDPNTRIVDDFMITTDNIEGNARGATLLPPMVLSSLHRTNNNNNNNQIISNLQPKRTRGPFAFETIKTIESDNPALSAADGEATTLESVSMPTTMSGEPTSTGEQTSRAERSQPETATTATISTANDKLLVRKKLYLGDEDSNEDATDIDLSNIHLVALNQNDPLSSTGATGSVADELDRFGNRLSLVASNSSSSSTRSANRFSTEPTIRCQFYGCKSKQTQEFICLNNSQICDDFIDCQDESDELDCVSLLKHHSTANSNNNNRLTFSNGEGIIYLNRKGSLAPMCIDYFLDHTKSHRQSQAASGQTTNSAHDLEAMQMDLQRKQEELIRQINTIGQYACSLQSFSRLVSVKINHHKLVDEPNLIRNSKLFHRLSIIGNSDRNSDALNAANGGSDMSFGSYKSGHSDHEVEISTSSECPSQRTVFVKCGGFDCGQDSFNLMDQSSSSTNGGGRSASRRKSGVIINDFPWLVKLFWRNSLACHGYLIDESWLLAPSGCFNTKTRAQSDSWTAEISYEHYGNYDYQSIETNRRNVESILMQLGDSGDDQRTSPIVLAKLDKPVRFSPLNRPICLPSLASSGGGGSVGNRTTGGNSDTLYRDCVTASLYLDNSNNPNQDLVLRKAKLLDLASCSEDFEGSGRDSICVEEAAASTEPQRDATRVLICSTGGSQLQANRSGSKWTIVGVYNSARESNPKTTTSRRLFTAVSSQIDRIVDTMNPKSPPSQFVFSSQNGDTNNPIMMSGTSGMTPISQSETCNMFRCSSGECLSWSRICDGLYDCSSHEDEKDCHK